MGKRKKSMCKQLPLFWKQFIDWYDKSDEQENVARRLISKYAKNRQQLLNTKSEIAPSITNVRHIIDTVHKSYRSYTPSQNYYDENNAKS